MTASLRGWAEAPFVARPRRWKADRPSALEVAAMAVQRLLRRLQRRYRGLPKGDEVRVHRADFNYLFFT
jgi:hypothetical protein